MKNLSVLMLLGIIIMTLIGGAPAEPASSPNTSASVVAKQYHPATQSPPSPDYEVYDSFDRQLDLYRTMVLWLVVIVGILTLGFWGPKDALAYLNRACAYSLKFGSETKEEDKKRAVADLHRAIQLAPENKEMAKTDADFDPEFSLLFRQV